MHHLRFLRVLSFTSALTVLAGCAATPALPSSVMLSSKDEANATVLAASLEQTSKWTAEAFRELGIRLQEFEADADCREYFGIRKDTSIRATLNREADGQTRVEVVAEHKDAASALAYAQKVLERIARKQPK
jgi:hypothetical protein